METATPTFDLTETLSTVGHDMEEGCPCTPKGMTGWTLVARKADGQVYIYGGDPDATPRLLADAQAALSL